MSTKAPWIVRNDKAILNAVVTSGSPTVTAPALVQAAFDGTVDTGSAVMGNGIPANTYVGVVNSATSIGLSSSPTSNVPVNAIASGTVTITLARLSMPVTYGDLLLANAAGGAVVISLPRPSIGLGPITVKKTDSSANAVNVTRSGTAVIDGVATQALTSQFGFLTVVPDGVNWHVVASAGTGVPATAPGAPTIGTATGGDTTATLNWTAPASNGGSAITGYVAKLYRASDNVEIGSQSVGVVLTYQFTGLTNGTAVYGKVAAVNAMGTGAQSAASNTVTPSSEPTAPGAPTIGTATGGDTQATANWTAPGSNGGSAITGYQVKTYRASDNVELFTDTVGVVLTFTRTGLTNGVGVYFRVAAINAIGTGAQSAASNTVTPAAFSPASVPNTVDWTEADQFAGPPANDTALASVTPSVGTHTYSQATGTKQPIFKASVAAWNNKPVMRFARASSQEMTTAAPVMTALDNYTFIAVCSLVGTGAADAAYCNGNPAANGYSIFPVSGQDVGKVAELVNAIAWHDTNINSTTGPTIIMVRRTAGVTRIWVNGVEGTVAQASNGPVANITDSTRIGSSPATFHDGDIAAVFAANASVSVANLNALGNYWATKYGITWTTIT